MTIVSSCTDKWKTVTFLFVTHETVSFVLIKKVNHPLHMHNYGSFPSLRVETLMSVIGIMSLFSIYHIHRTLAI